MKSHAMSNSVTEQRSLTLSEGSVPLNACCVPRTNHRPFPDPQIPKGSRSAPLRGYAMVVINEGRPLEETWKKEDANHLGGLF